MAGEFGVMLKQKAAHDLATGLYSRALLDTVQTGFAIWGIIEWKRDGKEGEE